MATLETLQIINQIEQNLQKNSSLQGFILPLLKRSDKNSKNRFVWLSNMNDNQKIAQLQNHSLSHLRSIQKHLSEQNINLQEVDINQQIEASDPESEMQVENDSSEHRNSQQDEMQDQGQLQEEDFEEPNYQLPVEEEDPVEKDSEGAQFDGDESDVGLYGERLDDQDGEQENYDNQFDEQEFKEFEKQFGDSNKKVKTKIKKPKQSQDDENDDEGHRFDEQGDSNDDGDDDINDNFDHFRELQLENEKEQQKGGLKTEMDSQIDKLEEKIQGKKDWMVRGQIKGKERPVNSLLEYDLQFQSGIKYSHQITEEKNSDLEQLIKKRILSEAFDDRQRYVNSARIRETFNSLKEVSRQKSQMGLGELYENQFKNFLGIGDNKTDKAKKEIMDSFKELNYYLDSLTNFSFTPKPTSENFDRNANKQAIIVEEKVPLTMWNGQKQNVKKDDKFTFQSEKEVDKHSRRLKTKRIKRQRNKEQARKALNKKIQYGGITKAVALAKKKAAMNSKQALKTDGAPIKYNKSDSVFKKLNDRKPGDKKPNANISKMKI